MNIILFLVASGILILLILHASLFRGIYLSLSFFVLVLVWAFIKEFSHFYFPYGFNETGTFLLISKLWVVAGWAISFYLGWCISELILERIGVNKKIIHILLLSCFIVASISYFMEAIGVSLGWWQWYIKNPNRKFTIFLVGGCSVRILEAWAYFGLHFLLSFFLIFYSKYRDRNWKYLFLLFPLSSLYTIALKKPSIEARFVLLFLFAWIIFGSSETGCRNAKPPYFYPKWRMVLKYIPESIFTFIILLVSFLGIFVAGKVNVMISVLPAIFILLLTVKRIPLYVIFASVIPLVFIIQEKIIPVLAPLLIILALCLNKKMVFH